MFRSLIAPVFLSSLVTTIVIKDRKWVFSSIIMALITFALAISSVLSVARYYVEYTAETQQLIGSFLPTPIALMICWMLAIATMIMLTLYRKLRATIV